MFSDGDLQAIWLTVRLAAIVTAILLVIGSLLGVALGGMLLGVVSTRILAGLLGTILLASAIKTFQHKN